ncbi:MoaD/ThiS family protein [Desulfonatronospira sp.]|uniref:MoaD/ThiS family protein n=1 Tax=Desulfonatronospira sp. TaxID=1962951 RepID=UPI0025C18B04|nr:MoaD/ThiS family protein [Desulfonatronospira sp.]
MKQTKTNQAISGNCFQENPITLKLHLESILEKYTPEDAEHFPMPRESTLADLLKHLGLGEDQVMLAFVNGRMANLKTRLADRDAVSLCPYICGG